MEQLILQNSGKYSAELTKMCTHLISEISFLRISYRTNFKCLFVLDNASFFIIFRLYTRKPLHFQLITLSSP